MHASKQPGENSSYTCNIEKMNTNQIINTTQYSNFFRFINLLSAVFGCSISRVSTTGGKTCNIVREN